MGYIYPYFPKTQETQPNAKSVYSFGESPCCFTTLQHTSVRLKFATGGIVAASHTASPALPPRCTSFDLHTHIPFGATTEFPNRICE